MKINLRFLLSVLFTVLLSVGNLSAQALKISEKDLEPMTRGRWTGNLTYRDYGTGKPVTILCDVLITRVKGEINQWNFSFEYPKEPKANRVEIVELTNDGRKFDGETIIERNKSSDGVLKFITEIRGEDDGKSAQIRRVYVISTSEFTITKLVRFDNLSEFMERNSYKWQR